ncbi:MAG: ABC transporter permease [Bacteroidales bacterium]|jgi:lipoprotein-releasing system permease protein|nr:ABC transporter permease [Bacteroidales bacterium]
MNISFFISQKILSQKNKRLSGTVVKISVLSIALGISILIISFAISEGFADNIREKVIGFGSHIEVTHLNNNTSYENDPIEKIDLQQLTSIYNVSKVQFFATKAGIVQGEEDIEGVLFKGVDYEDSMPFFSQHLVKGRLPKANDSAVCDEILISQSLANKLNADTATRLPAFFVQKPVRQRMFKVVGVYNTGFSTFDKSLIICDLRQIQKLNQWTQNQVGGAEILLNDFNKIDTSNTLINNALPYNFAAYSIIERYRDIFEWIELFKQNVLILIILITIIAAVSLISTQFIFTLEHITTIGILKTLGCNYAKIGNIFVFVLLKILALGLIIGNVAGLLLCFVQSKWHIIRLNPENYYVSYVPIDVQILHVLLINAGAILLSILILILPSYWVSNKIKTVDALRMD